MSDRERTMIDVKEVLAAGHQRTSFFVERQSPITMSIGAFGEARDGYHLCRIKCAQGNNTHKQPSPSAPGAETGQAQAASRGPRTSASFRTSPDPLSIATRRSS